MISSRVTEECNPLCLSDTSATDCNPESSPEAIHELSIDRNHGCYAEKIDIHFVGLDLC